MYRTQSLKRLDDFEFNSLSLQLSANNHLSIERSTNNSLRVRETKQEARQNWKRNREEFKIFTFLYFPLRNPELGVDMSGGNEYH